MSGPAAGTGKASAGSRIRSGGPSFQPSANVGGGGRSLGSPRGRPPSAQAERTASSAGLSDWSCLSFGPTPRVGFQGGIDRSSVTEHDVLGPLAGLLVGLQRERPDLVPAVAVLALRLEDRGHVLGVGVGGCRLRAAFVPFADSLGCGGPLLLRGVLPLGGLIARRGGDRARGTEGEDQGSSARPASRMTRRDPSSRRSSIEVAGI